MRVLTRRGAAACVLLGVVACCQAAADENWPSYGRSADEQRFSPLTQIAPDTLGRLGLAWSLDLPKQARTLEGTPLAIDGVVYFTTSLSVTYAVEAASGKLVWKYDPQSWQHNPKALRTTPGQANRGVAYRAGSIYLGASDGRLISLNAQTGQVNWIAQSIEERDSRKQITGAPRVCNDKVIVGNTGADFGTRGYVTTFDAATGKLLWRFYVVPGDPSKGFENDAMKLAAKTWSGQWWRWGGGGTVWNAITCDPQFNRIYIGTGNSSNYNPAQRSPDGGDNLFLASIVALDANTGEYVWHYQVNPREAWDYKATADLVLADLKIAGKPVKALMQAPTDGFFYVIDRTNGKLLSAEKLGKVTWAERIDLVTGRPVEAPNIRYEKGPVTFWPSPYGIHNWQPMAFDPTAQLVFIPGMKLGASYTSTAEDAQQALQLTVGSPRYWFPIGASFGPALHPDADDGTGMLIAWDPIKQSARWTVKLDTPWNGGALATASRLVFQGTADGWLRAYASQTGKLLWKFYVGNGIISAPVTYSVNGQQYLTVMAGGSNPGGGRLFDAGWRYGKHAPRVLTFRLDAKGTIAPTAPPDFSVHSAFDASSPVDPQSAARGARIWPHLCLMCHGVAAASAGGLAPDLRESAAAQNFSSLRSILHDGALVQGGMPLFDELTEGEIHDLQAYIRATAREAASAQPAHH